MSIESAEPINRKLLIGIGIITGLINALVWIILGWLVLSTMDLNISIWWVLFCLVLNISVALGISQKWTGKFRRLFWIVGVTLFITIFCAFILGFGASYGITDWGGVAFIVGAGQGVLIGLVIGVIVGIKTSSSNISSKTLIQRIGEGIVTSTLVGIGISAISVAIFATSTWMKDSIDSLNYPDLIGHVFLNVLFITPAGVIPSVLTGVTTSLTIHAVFWWLKRENTAKNGGVG